MHLGAGTPPYLDRHRLVVAAPRERVWAALEDYADERLRGGGLLSRSLARVLGTRPAAGFAAVEVDPGRRLVLAGQHRFARYRLVWLLDDAAAGTALTAVSHAAFPGLPGAVYRTLVVRSGLHVLVTRRLLRQVGRRALAPTDRVPPA